MENNNLTSNPVPALSEQERRLAMLIHDFRHFMGMVGSQPGQMLQLQKVDQGRQLRNPDNLDYLLAISG
jgi:hypothetical protein